MNSKNSDFEGIKGIDLNSNFEGKEINLNNNFEGINLSEKMKENLSKLGYNSLTTIQEKVIPVALAGKDVIGQSGTGTGKTAAFLIPIIESVEPKSGLIQAIILAPTRELALQIKEEGIKLSKETGVNIVAVYGGEDINNQINQIKRSEVVVGTPGRVFDHLERRTLKFENLKFFVLDEVDEMLKRGFIDDIKKIAGKAKSEKLQTLFFSATISRETKDLSDSFLKNPVFIKNEQKDSTIKPLISQYYLTVRDGKNKLSSLMDIIHFQNPELAIIFAGTKRMVDIIAEELSSEGFSVDKIHSDLSQKQRTTVYNNFKNKKIRFLIATDIAARGIDVEGITHVYNYDVPQDSEFYVHRIGRTGRAGLTGQSIILLNAWEVRRQLPFLEKLTGEKIQPIYHPSQEEIDEVVENNSIAKVIKKIEDSKERKLSEKASKLLESYTPEQILNGLISTFVVKRKKVVQNFDQNNDRGDRPQRSFNRGGYGSRDGSSNSRGRSSSYSGGGDRGDRSSKPYSSRSSSDRRSPRQNNRFNNFN
ncbi:MAG: ATP-dependent RNA helicase CshA [Mycoplasmataceae bacterium]|nr:MAG: ATP-dependent RNA helicase CshA [Mycoplasmataceae bacterium]